MLLLLLQLLMLLLLLLLLLRLPFDGAAVGAVRVEAVALARIGRGLAGAPAAYRRATMRNGKLLSTLSQESL